MWRGALDWRRLRVLIKGLPGEGTALAREAHGISGQWSMADWLLEHLANVVQDGVWAFMEVNRDSARNPKPVPRPKPVALPRAPVEIEAEASRPTTPDGRRIATSRETFRVLTGALK